MTLGDDLDDGRAGENENVRADVEIIEGSPFADTITGSDADKRERYIGGPGNDAITGLGGSDVFHEGSAPNGSDAYYGGSDLGATVPEADDRAEHPVAERQRELRRTYAIAAISTPVSDAEALLDEAAM